jgi:hypothetical protein
MVRKIPMPPTRRDSKLMQALRKIALGYPEVQEGLVCMKAAFEARGKRFLFIGSDDASYNAMVKLRDSLAEAANLAANVPGCYKVGGSGWVTITLSHEKSPPPGLLERWIDESYRLLVSKQLVALLPERGPQPQAKAKSAKKVRPKRVAKKKSTTR